MSTSKFQACGDEGIVSGSRDDVRPLVVSVEGNIGCGKSTFLNYCLSKPEIEVCPEPIEKWRDVGGENLLAKYYADSRRWAMEFQLQVGMTVLDIYRAPSYKPMKLIERSLLSSRYCFMESMLQTGVLEPTTYHVLEGWYTRALTDWRSRPHCVVYLRTTPSVAYERMTRRGRGERERYRAGIPHRLTSTTRNVDCA